MPSFRRPSRIVVASGTLIGGTVGLTTTAMSLPPLNCGPGATGISPTVCEAVFTTAGATTWTPPANANTVEALLVGGGGAGAMGPYSYGYGGEGGGVKVINITSKNEISIFVGGQETQTTLTNGVDVDMAHSGANGFSSGNNGAFQGDPYGGGGGAGAGGNANKFDGGTGVIVDSLVSSGSLFSGDTDCFGGGGATIYYNYNGMQPVGSQYQWFVGTASCGGGSATQTNDVASFVAPTAGSGGGGSANYVTGAHDNGASGRVVIRFTLNPATTTTTVAPTTTTTVPPTSTTTSTTTTVPPTTTTTSTTTTVPPTTTTNEPPSTTTTSEVTTTTEPATTTSTEEVTTSTETMLPRTGSSARNLVALGSLLTILGSLSVLLGRRRSEA